MRSTCPKSNAIWFTEWFITFRNSRLPLPPPATPPTDRQRKETLSILLNCNSLCFGYGDRFCSPAQVSKITAFFTLFYHNNQNKILMWIHITYRSVFTVQCFHSSHQKNNIIISAFAFPCTRWKLTWMCVFYCCVVCAPTAFIHRGKLQYKYLQQFCFLCATAVLLALHVPTFALFDWVRFFTDSTNTHRESKNNTTINIIDIVAMNVPFYMSVLRLRCKIECCQRGASAL